MTLKRQPANMTTGMLRLLAVALVVLACTQVDAIAPKHRHSALDPLTTHDGALSEAAKLKHSQAFHTKLTKYAANLDAAAELMMLQLDEMDQHQHLAEHDVGVDEQTDFEADGDSESEGEVSGEVDSEGAVDGESDSDSESLTSVTLEQELHRTWAEGDAKAVAHVLEHKHGVSLTDPQRRALVHQLKQTMQIVASAVDNGEEVNQSQLDSTLDSLLSKVVFPVAHKSMLEQENQGSTTVTATTAFQAQAEAEAAVLGTPEEPADWVKETLLNADRNLDIGNQSSYFVQELQSGAKKFAEQTDERVLRYKQPLEVTMENILRLALNKVDDKNSTLGKELRYVASEHVLENDPTVNPGPDWAQAILADAVTALGDPNRTITKELTEVAKQVVVATDPSVDPGPTWAQEILAGALQDAESGKGEIHQRLHDAAEEYHLLNPEAVSTDDLAHDIFTNIDEDELEARLRFQARKVVFEDVVAKNKAKCERLRKRGGKCDMKKFIHDSYVGLDAILRNEVPKVLAKKKDEPLATSGQLAIARSKTTTPESVRDIEMAIKNNIDPWMNLPGRQPRELHTKTMYVIDLLDGDAERCPKKCSLHGQCIMDMNTTAKSPSGAANVHPFHCICDTGYVGDACQIKLDMHLRWLLTEGAAPFPKCCNVCEKQREVPLKWDDIPAYNNPFSSFAPECQPFPRISMYSREDGSHELIKDRRPNPKCSHPLGEITRTDPIVALELASDLAAAQQLVSGGTLAALSGVNAQTWSRMDHASRATHRAKVHHAARVIKEASETATKAAATLAAKLHLTDLTTTKYSSIDLEQLLEDYREMPNEMEECCLFCQLDKEPSTFMTQSDAGANVGPNAILNQDPRKDNTVDAQHRRMAMKRADRRHAQLTGDVPKQDQDCCVVCPYNLRELERLEEAAWVRKHSSERDEMDKVFLETFAEVERDRRRRHEPVPCCPACPSQFLIAHAFPANPWTQTRTLPNTGPA